MYVQEELIKKLIFGNRSDRRYTQDSPVLPDVWLAFARQVSADSDARTNKQEPIDLLLTPHRASYPARVATLLQEALEVERGRERWRSSHKSVSAANRVPDVAFNQAIVVARLYFDEVVRIVLPMSSWWNHYVQCYYETHAQLIAALEWPPLRAALSELLRGETRVLLRDPADENKAVPPDLLWMILVVGTLNLAFASSSRKHLRTPEDVEENLDELLELLPALLKDTEAWSEAGARRYELEGEERDLADEDPGRENAPLTLEPDEVGRLIWLLNCNRPAAPAISHSVNTIKADAARRVFDISCADLTWAVLDSGIDATHPAFRTRRDDGSLQLEAFEPKDDEERRWNNHTRIIASYDFTRVRDLLRPGGPELDRLPKGLRERFEENRLSRRQAQDLRRSLQSGRDIDWELLKPFLEIPHRHTDPSGGQNVYKPPRHEHGTHVAGVLAADWRQKDGELTLKIGAPPLRDSDLQGVCPDLKLYDLRVLDDDGNGDEFGVMAALQFVRYLNAHKDYMVVQGVNLSFSIPHAVANFACGRTPVCEECDRLFGAGIVVVAAAGNAGYQQYQTLSGVLDGYHSISITDPGNADCAITVGATHRYRPHTYGVSYFSSRGPTGDGRLKPDLVAPGEKVVAPIPDKGTGRKDGTSMAAPHVSGGAALLMARHKELVGEPEKIKHILCSTATDLGRERYFQGAGMLDILRALQSV